MKKIQWRDPNHMIIETGHKEFDRKADCISTGNVLGDVQYSGFIRPENETECNGLQFPTGHLRAFDLRWWTESVRIPWHVRDYVLAATKTKSVILYQFFHRRGEKKTVHGHVVTTPDHKLMAVIHSGPAKSRAIIHAVLPYITEAA
jgi:hypothetical protein